MDEVQPGCEEQADRIDGRQIALILPYRGHQRMECTQRLHLQKNYTAASAIFDSARARVQRRIWICTESEFGILRDELDWASAQLDSAHAALIVHTRDHCCMVQGSTVTQD